MHKQLLQVIVRLAQDEMHIKNEDILTSNSHDWKWGTMINRIRLSLYEHGIAESLAEFFGYLNDDAQGLIVKYIKVIRLLGVYDTCLDHAERLHNANKVGIFPNQWLSRIKEVSRSNLLDKGILE